LHQGKRWKRPLRRNCINAKKVKDRSAGNAPNRVENILRRNASSKKRKDRSAGKDPSAGKTNRLGKLKTHPPKTNLFFSLRLIKFT
jgi:hypothetical protein